MFDYNNLICLMLWCNEDILHGDIYWVGTILLFQVVECNENCLLKIINSNNYSEILNLPNTKKNIYQDYLHIKSAFG